MLLLTTNTEKHRCSECDSTFIADDLVQVREKIFDEGMLVASGECPE